MTIDASHLKECLSPHCVTLKKKQKQQQQVQTAAWEAFGGIS